MFKRLDPPRRAWAACLLVSLLPLAAHADGPLAGALVRDMLDIDAQRALIAERQQASGSMFAVGATPAASHPSQGLQADPMVDSAEAVPARLVGIAGVGSKLTAIINLGNQQAHYTSGRAAPASGPDLGLKLQRIDSPCAHFVDQSGSAIALCLNGEAQ